MTRAFVSLWLAIIFASAPALAQTFPERGRSPVVDQADLLSPAQEAELSGKAEALFARTGRRFVVATVRTLEGRTIEDYGYRLGRFWKLGDEKKDDGVILLVAPNERQVDIETGYGATVFLTDAEASLIIRNTIIPRFKEDDLAGGIIAGSDEITKLMELPPDEAARRAKEAAAAEARRSERSVNPFPVLFIVIIFFVIIGSIASRSGGKRYRRRDGGISPWVILWGLNELSRGSRGGWGGGGGWSGGGGFGGGGGGFSGGGGSFGGGGASGGW